MAAPPVSFTKTFSHDLVRFIRPLARRLRADSSLARAVGSSLAVHTHDALPSGSPRAVDGRTPGICVPVTNFSPRMNALLSSPLSHVPAKVTVPLYQCPLCAAVDGAGKGKGAAFPWMTPQELMRHMSWMHTTWGNEQCRFRAHNECEMRRLCQSLTGLLAGQVIVMVDVANMELNGEGLLFELMTSPDALAFFRNVPCAFVCVHEVFISHTSLPGHTFFQLSRMNPSSDIYTIYAATRNESGDLASAALMGELLLRNTGGGGPAIVLLTKDRAQKSCVSEMFCGVAGRCGRVLLPRMTIAGILSSLCEANVAVLGGDISKERLMLRRSSVTLFRRTPISRSAGGELFVRPTLDQIPPADECRGFFGPLNGPLKFFRLIDIKWMMNRAVGMHREYYIATPTLYFFLWMFSWKGASIYYWGDAAPPRKMDWNSEETGHLPDGFVPTVVAKGF